MVGVIFVIFLLKNQELKQEQCEIDIELVHIHNYNILIIEHFSPSSIISKYFTFFAAISAIKLECPLLDIVSKIY